MQKELRPFLLLKIDCLKTPFIGVLVCKAIRPMIVLQANNPEMNLGTTALCKQRGQKIWKCHKYSLVRWFGINGVFHLILFCHYLIRFIII